MKDLLNQIVQGDCLEVLRKIPDNTIDAVITDPPYSSGGLSHAERSKDPVSKYQQSNNKIVHRPSFYGDNRDSRSWLHWCTMWISECHRILKPGGYFLMFSDWRQLPTASDALQFGNLIWRGTVAWDKTEGSRAPHKGYFRHQVEYILWGTKGPCHKAVHGGPWPGCFRVSVKQKDKFHLTGKPTELMENLVQIVPEKSIIVDPFAGSGTTLVAAKKLKRMFIGAEKEQYNVEIAHKRLIETA